MVRHNDKSTDWHIIDLDADIYVCRRVQDESTDFVSCSDLLLLNVLSCGAAALQLLPTSPHDSCRTC
jgi:hypothetical protein